MIALGNQSLLTDEERRSLESLLPYASEQERLEIQSLLGPAETVAKTAAEAGKLLGVSEKTIDRWLREEGFPGRAGDQGRRNGYFPIERIRQWSEREIAGRATTEDSTSARHRKLEAEAATRELELEERLGQLVDRGEVESLIAQQIATARSLLEEIPETIANAMPAKMPERLRRLVAKIARRKVAQAIEALAEAESLSRNQDDDE
jgi:phage terminase Nu1 subunit (DNA packaging protein)